MSILAQLKPYIQLSAKILASTIREYLGLGTVKSPSYRRELRLSARIGEIPTTRWTTQFDRPHGFDLAYFKECLLINRFAKDERFSSDATLVKLVTDMNKAFDRLDQAFKTSDTPTVQACRKAFVTSVNELYIQYGEQLNQSELPQGPTSKAMQALDQEFTKAATGFNTYEHYATAKGGMRDNGWTVWLDEDSGKWKYAVSPDLAEFLCDNEPEGKTQDLKPLKTSNPMQALTQAEMCHFHQALAARGGSKLVIDPAKKGAARVRVEVTTTMPEMTRLYEAGQIPDGQKELGMPVSHAGDPLMYITGPDGTVRIKVIQRQDDFNKSLKAIQLALASNETLLSTTQLDETATGCTTDLTARQFLEALVEYESTAPNQAEKEAFLTKHFGFDGKFSKPRYTSLVRKVFSAIKSAPGVSPDLSKALETIVAFPGGMREGDDPINTLAHEISEELGLELSKVQDALKDAQLVPVYIGVNAKDPRNSQEGCMFTRAYKLDLGNCPKLLALLNEDQGADDAFAALWTNINDATDLKMYSSHGQIMMHLYADLVDQAAKKLHGPVELEKGESENLQAQQAKWLKIMNDFCTAELGATETGEARFKAPEKRDLTETQALSQQPVVIAPPRHQQDIAQLVRELSTPEENSNAYQLQNNMHTAQELLQIGNVKAAQTLMTALRNIAKDRKKDLEFFAGDKTEQKSVLAQVEQQYQVICFANFKTRSPRACLTAMKDIPQAIAMLETRALAAKEVSHTVIKLSPSEVKQLQKNILSLVTTMVSEKSTSQVQSMARTQLSHLIRSLQPTDINGILSVSLLASCKKHPAKVSTIIKLAMDHCVNDSLQQALFEALAESKVVLDAHQHQPVGPQVLMTLLQYRYAKDATWTPKLFNLCDTLRQPRHKKALALLLNTLDTVIQDKKASDPQATRLRRIYLAMKYPCTPIRLSAKVVVDSEDDEMAVNELDKLDEMLALYETIQGSPVLKSLPRAEQDALFINVSPSCNRPEKVIQLLNKYVKVMSLRSELMRVAHDHFGITKLYVTHSPTRYTSQSKVTHSPTRYTSQSETPNPTTKKSKPTFPETQGIVEIVDEVNMGVDATSEFDIDFGDRNEIDMRAETLSSHHGVKILLGLESEKNKEFELIKHERAQDRFTYWNRLIDQELAKPESHHNGEFTAFSKKLFSVSGGCCKAEDVKVNSATKAAIRAHVAAIVPPETASQRDSLNSVIASLSQAPETDTPRAKINAYYEKCLQKALDKAVKACLSQLKTDPGALLKFAQQFNEIGLTTENRAEHPFSKALQASLQKHAGTVLRGIANNHDLTSPAQKRQLRALAHTTKALPTNHIVLYCLRKELLVEIHPTTGSQPNSLENFCQSVAGAQNSTSSAPQVTLWKGDISRELLYRTNSPQLASYRTLLGKQISDKSPNIALHLLRGECSTLSDTPKTVADVAGIVKHVKTRSLEKHIDAAKQKHQCTVTEALLRVLQSGQDVSDGAIPPKDTDGHSVRLMFIAYVAAHPAAYKGQVIVFRNEDLPCTAPLTLQVCRELGLTPVIITEGSKEVTDKVAKKAIHSGQASAMTLEEFNDEKFREKVIAFSQLKQLALKSTHNPVEFLHKVGRYPFAEKPQETVQVKDSKSEITQSAYAYATEEGVETFMTVEEEQLLRETVAPRLLPLIINAPNPVALIQQLTTGPDHSSEDPTIQQLQILLKIRNPKIPKATTWARTEDQSTTFKRTTPVQKGGAVESELTVTQLEERLHHDLKTGELTIGVFNTRLEQILTLQNIPQEMIKSIQLQLPYFFHNGQNSMLDPEKVLCLQGRTKSYRPLDRKDNYSAERKTQIIGNIMAVAEKYSGTDSVLQKVTACLKRIIPDSLNPLPQVEAVPVKAPVKSATISLKLDGATAIQTRLAEKPISKKDFVALIQPIFLQNGFTETQVLDVAKVFVSHSKSGNEMIYLQGENNIPPAMKYSLKSRYGIKCPYELLVSLNKDKKPWNTLPKDAFPTAQVTKAQELLKAILPTELKDGYQTAQ